MKLPLLRRLAILPASILLMATLPPLGKVEQLGWLAGAWRAQSADGRWAEEYWTPVRGGVMLGSGFSGRGSRADFEQMRIHYDANGYVTFTAQPGAGPPVSFQFAGYGPTEVTFDNPQHDFPQRIRYRRVGNRLEATVSLIDGSRAASWSYRRVR